MFIHYNLLKQIPSGVFRGFTWGRTKQLRSYPEPMLSPSHPHTHELPYHDDTSKSLFKNAKEANAAHTAYPDREIRGPHDVEADMLANADDSGRTIYTGSPEVRRRAAIERGIRPFFHGGGNTAFCIDMRWEDPVKGREKVKVKIWEEDGEGREAVKDVERWVGGEEVGVDWGVEPLEVCSPLPY